jgi:hypothetical protein
MPPVFDKTVPMSPWAALLRQLRDLKQRSVERDIEPSAVRAQWLAEVEQLLDGIASWMRPAVEEGLARIERARVHADDDLGAYDAPALKIVLPALRVVWVRPVGTLRVGARGLVDVVCGSSRALVVLNRSGAWKIRGSGPAAALVPLDSQSFARVLGDLIY